MSAENVTEIRGRVSVLTFDADVERATHDVPVDPKVVELIETGRAEFLSRLIMVEGVKGLDEEQQRIVQKASCVLIKAILEAEDDVRETVDDVAYWLEGTLAPTIADFTVEDRLWVIDNAAQSPFLRVVGPWVPGTATVHYAETVDVPTGNYL